ncbi:putative transcription factor interactor and regulator CCHC(Zn) family [Helianthus annuus]|nr:putative transcription factor interactor and regulator CCHC(Zn) family [Helianthus annuus]
MTLRSIGPVALCIKPLTTLSLCTLLVSIVCIHCFVFCCEQERRDNPFHHNRLKAIQLSFKSSMHLKVYWDLISCFLKYVGLQCHFISVEEIRSRKLILASGLDYFHIHMPLRRQTQMPTNEAELQQVIAAAIAQYAASQGGTGGSKSCNTGNNNPPHGCTHKQFLDCKPVNFDGTGGAVAFVRWAEKTESVLRMSKCAPDHQVTYISRLFVDGALSWWNLQVQTLGEAAAYAMTWNELKELMRRKYCSCAEIQKLETEFWHLKMEGSKIAEYVQRFHDLSHVVPYMVTPEFKRIERFIWGLAPQIISMVTSSKPATITEAINLIVALTEEAIRLNKFSGVEQKKKETHVESSGGNKRKFSNFKQGTSGVVKKEESSTPAQATAGTGRIGKGYMGTHPKCNTCQRHHSGRCGLKVCEACGKTGHSKDTCWATVCDNSKSRTFRCNLLVCYVISWPIELNDKREPFYMICACYVCIVYIYMYYK